MRVSDQAFRKMRLLLSEVKKVGHWFSSSGVRGAFCLVQNGHNYIYGQNKEGLAFGKKED
jgi:hypothetical protein